MKASNKLPGSKCGCETAFIVIMGISLFIWISLLAAGDGSQLNIFFFRCQDYMSDFTNVILYSADRDPYGSDLNGIQEHAYLPLSYMITYLFHNFIPHRYYLDSEIWTDPVLMNLIVLFLGFFSSVFFLQLYDLKTGPKPIRFMSAGLMICSGIYMFMMERGQLLVIAVVCSTFYLVNYNNKNLFIRELAFIALAVSAALKFSPAFLGILLIFEKRYKEAFRLIIYGLVFCFLPFLFFKGGFSDIPVFLQNMKANTEYYWGDGTYSFLIEYRLSDPGFIVLAYVFMCFFAALLTVAAPIQPKAWKRFLSLLMIIIMVPVHSGIYNVVFMFPVFILFLNDKEHTASDIIYFLFMIALLSPLVIRSYSMPDLSKYYLSAMYFFMGIESAVFMSKNKDKMLAYYKSFLPDKK